MKYAPAISLGLSVILAVVAFLVWRIGEGGAEATPPRLAVNGDTAAVEMRPVLVARSEVESGTAVEPNMVEVRSWPDEIVPPDALRTESEIVNRMGEPLLAQTHIFPGEPILAAKLAEKPPRRTLSQDIPEGLRAVSIAVTNETGVSGFVLPGDWVDVLAYERVPGGRDHRAYRATPLVRKIEVLAADHVFGSDAEGALPSSLVTLAVTFEQARQITAAARETRLGLALIGLDEIARRKSETEDTERVSSRPVAPRPVVRSTAKASPRPRAASVKVVHGTAVATITAPKSQLPVVAEEPGQ